MFSSVSFAAQFENETSRLSPFSFAFLVSSTSMYLMKLAFASESKEKCFKMIQIPPNLIEPFCQFLPGAALPTAQNVVFNVSPNPSVR